MTELISQGSVIAIVGYMLVFVVLGIIWGVLEIMKLFFVRTPKKENVPLNQQPKEPDLKISTTVDETDEDELIAVLTAAVAASMGRTSTYNLNIKSYRRVGSNSPAWNKISRQENLS